MLLLSRTMLVQEKSEADLQGTHSRYSALGGLERIKKRLHSRNLLQILTAVAKRVLNVSLATKVAAREYTVDKENPDISDTEGCKGFTSNCLGPNRGELTAKTMKENPKGGITSTIKFIFKVLNTFDHLDLTKN